LFFLVRYPEFTDSLVDRGRDKPSPKRYPVSPEGPSEGFSGPPDPAVGADDNKAPGGGIEEAIGDHKGPVMSDYFPMKVVEDEKPREENLVTPKGISDPGIQVNILCRRGIISNNRRTVLAVIISLW
jgi:hypothetical protein